jgi:hypothetical protein
VTVQSDVQAPAQDAPRTPARIVPLIEQRERDT